MKFYFFHSLVLFFLTISLVAKAQVAATLSPFEMQFVKINDSIYVSKYEVTNEEYLKFLASMDKKSKLYPQASIDSTGWQCCINMPELVSYHRHASFKDYPVVNIAYEGAVEYCKWLTKGYALEAAPNFKKPTFRLPSELEWELAAKGKNTLNIYGFEGVEIMDAKGSLKCNFKDITTAISVKKNKKKQTMTDHHVITAPVEFYAPNTYGLFNMSGNVAEMTLEKGYSKGGSWFSPREKVEIEQFEMYDKPQPFVGFRVFMVVKK